MSERWQMLLERLENLSPDPEALRNARPVPARPPRVAPAGRKLVIALVALALATGSFVLLAAAFRGEQATVVPNAPSGSATPQVLRGVYCSLPIPASASGHDIGCSLAVARAVRVASFVTSARRVEATARPEGVAEGRSVPAWFVTFLDATYEAGTSGCSAAGSVHRYTVVISAATGRLLAFDGPPPGCSVDGSPSAAPSVAAG